MSFVIYAIAVVGETNRAPFDLPEAESELVGGFHTEYSSFKFAMFFLAEYINMVTVSALATTLFLGGWRAPWPLSLWHGANSGWWPILWFVGKVVLGIFVFVWLRGTLPRLRYDQFMAFGWKVLIPINLVWILAVTAIHVLRDRGWDVVEGDRAAARYRAAGRRRPGADDRRGRRGAARGGTSSEERRGRGARRRSTFPIPPMDLVVPTPQAALATLTAARPRAEIPTTEPMTMADSRRGEQSRPEPRSASPRASA